MSNLVEMTEEEKHCLIRVDDGKANALSFDMLAQLNGALDKAEQAGKVVVICGRPGKFSAGFDLSVMGQGGDAMMQILLAGANLSRRLLAFETPVVLAASGHALAMGALLLLSADYRIGVTGDYKIGLNEVAIGMTLPQFGVELARARLAKTHAEKCVTLAQVYNALAAVEAGYLDEAVAEEELLPHAISVAERLSTLNMVAHRESKAKMRAELNAAMERAVELELGQVVSAG